MPTGGTTESAVSCRRRCVPRVTWPTAALLLAAGFGVQPGAAISHAEKVARLHDTALAEEKPRSWTDDIKDEMLNRYNGIIDAYNQSVSEVMNARQEGPLHILVRDFWLLVEMLLPGWELNLKVVIITICEVWLSLGWLLVYALYIFKDEHTISLKDWELRAQSGRHRRASVDGVDDHEQDPDLMLVFHHPGHSHPDGFQAASMEQVGHAIHPARQMAYASPGDEGVFLRMLAHIGMTTSDMWNEGDHEIGSWKQIFRRRPPQSKSDLRRLFVQDLAEAICTKMCLHIDVFSSASGKELYIAVSLLGKELTRHYIAKNHLFLQIRQDAVEKLGINQPSHEFASSPPYVAYDTKIVRELQLQGIFKSADERELYGRVDPLASRLRFRCIYAEISRVADLDAAVSAGLLLDWYPVHRRVTRDRLFDVWGDWGTLGLGYVQPLPWIREYFGSRVAFQFAWNGLYTKGLCALVPIALLFELNISRQYMEGFEKRPVVGPAILIIIWSRVMREVWKKEQKLFINYWCLDAERMSQTIRPSFRGDRKPAHHDGKTFELRRNDGMLSSYTFRKCVGRFATLAFCSLVALAIVIWSNIFHKNMNLVASIMLSVQIIVFSTLYNLLVDHLTQWENHKFQSDYFNSYMAKMFMFQCVNQYLPFGFLMIKQELLMNGDCGEENCLAVLRRQLVLKEVIFLLMGICQFFLKVTHVEVLLQKEVILAWWRREPRPEPLPFLEAQSRFVEYRTREQNQYAIKLVVCLGSTLLFGAVAPVMVPFNFFVFAMELKAQAYLLTRYSKRPVPRVMEGIGEMSSIVSLLTFLGVLTSSTLVVQFGELFRTATIQVKVAGWCLFFCLSALIQGVVGWSLHHDSKVLKVLMKRRAHVKDRLIEICRRSVPTVPPEPVPQEVLQERWDSIPLLKDLDKKGWDEMVKSSTPDHFSPILDTIP